MNNLTKAVIVLIVLTFQAYSQDFYNKLRTNGITYSHSFVSHYSEQDQDFINYMMHKGVPVEEIRAQYEKETLEYIGFLLRIENKTTEEDRSLISILLKQSFKDAARADLLRVAFYIWRDGCNETGYKRLGDLVRTCEGEEFENCFGEFMALYNKLYLLKHINRKNNIDDIVEKDSVIDLFFSKYAPLIEKSGVVMLKEDGSFEYDFSLQPSE